MNEHVRKCLCSVVPKLDSKPFLSKRSQRDDMCEPKKSMTCKALEKSQVRKGKEVEEQSTVEL